jgi:hypothetical protein
MPSKSKKQVRLKILFLIVDWDKEQLVSEIFEKRQSLVSFVHQGSGTANSDILNLLGLGVTDKAVFISLVQSTKTERLIQAVRNILGTNSNGAGIAFTIPLSGINAVVLQMFTQKVIPEGENNEKSN